MAAPSTVSDLGCPLCQKPLQDPKLLPCTHLACRDCLVTLLDDDDHATCPLCYVIILSDACWVHGDIGTLVDQLPTDLAIKELVESKDALSGDHVCGACDGDTPATSFCFECDVKLCRGCEKVHSKLAATRGHGVEEMKTLTAERLASSHRAPCEKHHDRSAELFCEDHRMAICPHCVLEHCQCSKLNSLAGVVEQERVALSERVRVLRDKENTLTVQIGQLEQEVRDAQAHWATMRDEVNATFDHLNEKLETRRHEMLAFLDDKEAVFIEPKKEEQRVLNKERVKAGAHASSADRLVKEASDGALLGMLDKLKGRLDVVEKPFLLPDNEEEDTVAVVTFTPERVDVLERSIGELGLITMKPVRMETQGPKENEAENDDIDNEQPERAPSPVAVPRPPPGPLAYTAPLGVNDCVQRGPDWNAFQESLDGSPPGLGRVIQVGHGEERFTRRGWVLVQWIASRRARWYRAGAEGCHDVEAA